MHIAVVMLNVGRGSGQVARQHAQLLMDRGHRVWYVQPGNTGSVRGAVNIDVWLPGTGVPVHEYLPSVGELGRPVSEMSVADARPLAWAYDKALSALPDIDVFIAHHANLSTVAVHRVASRRRRPFVTFVHGTGIEPRYHGGYSDRVWARIEDAVDASAGIIVTSVYVRDVLLEPLIAVPERRILVLPVGVDLEEFRADDSGSVQARFDLPHRYVICPGALTTSKGPQNVVAATEHFADLAPTVFIGDGPLRADLTARLGDRGRFLGFVSDADKAALIDAATLLAAAPEKREHFGIIYVEALAAGTVPVAYEGGGVDSIVTPDVGVLTERRPDALGAAIRALLEDDEERLTMASRGRRRAEEHFAPDVLADRLETWLGEIVGGWAKPASSVTSTGDADAGPKNGS